MVVPITVIMPVYNVQDYLERSIMSIQNQSFTDWELIIVNDGSTDNSAQICDDFADADSRIKVIHQENAGSGRARQNALNNANGKYICFVDPDDYLSEEALSSNYELAEKHNTDIVINGFIELVDKSGVEKIYHKPTISGLLTQETFQTDFMKSEKTFTRALWNKLYSHQFIKDNNCKFSDQRVGQDALFNYEAYQYLSSAYVNNQTYYHYDTSREGSAVKGYKPNRGLYEKKIADSYTSLIKGWGLFDYFEQDIYHEYWMAVFTTIKNFSFKDCPLTVEQKVANLKDIVSDSNINQALIKLNHEKLNKFRRFLIKLINRNQYKAALSAMKIRLMLM